jgi:hypothetical protein
MKRRVILDLAVTLDGFIEGKNGEVDWCIMDPDSYIRLIRFFTGERAMTYGGNLLKE